MSNQKTINNKAAFDISKHPATSIYVPYKVEDFTIRLNPSKIEISFYADIIGREKEDSRDTDYPLNEFMAWLTDTQDEFLMAFQTRNNFILWLDAMKAVNDRIVEKFINYKMNAA